MAEVKFRNMLEKVFNSGDVLECIEAFSGDKQFRMGPHYKYFMIVETGATNLAATFLFVSLNNSVVTYASNADDIALAVEDFKQNNKMFAINRILPCDSISLMVEG